MHEHITGRFADGLIEHEERQREYKIIVLDEEWRFISKPGRQRGLACPIDEGEEKETDKRDD